MVLNIPDPRNDNLEYFKTPLPIVPREEWGAAPPYTLNLIGMPPPTMFILLMFTRTIPCKTDQECETILRECQRVHMEQRKLADIQWNFMIGGNGKVYEGRGWTTNATKDIENLPFNFKSIDVAYIGFHNEEVTREMKIASSRLIRRGLVEKHINNHVFQVLDDMIYRPENFPNADPDPDYRKVKRIFDI